MSTQLTLPMTMMDFFRKSEGIWYSQRTVHRFDYMDDESGESNITIDVLDKTDAKVIEVCQQQDIDPTLASGGARFIWQDNLESSEPNPNYGAILVDIPDPEYPQKGKFLRNRGYVEGIPVVGVYNFAKDGVLTIETEYEKNQGQERAWFITDDFRVRVMTVKIMNGVNQMAYCSERRCVSRSTLDAMVEKNRLRGLQPLN